MTWLYEGGLYRIYEHGQLLGALHSREAAETYIAACLPVAAFSDSRQQKRMAA
jgi:hypothetical protein